MDSTGGGEQPGAGPGTPGDRGRAGQSGEGARSALEHLLRQEQARDAQAPREREVPPPGGPPRG